METSIRNNVCRNGNFTSSGIVALTKSGRRDMTDKELEQYKKDNPKGKRTTIDETFGDAAYTYICEKNMERRLGISLDSESNARPLVWGNFCEKRAFNTLGITYKECSQETIQHPTILTWYGSPDGENFASDKAVVEVKCPYTRKSFCQLVDPLYNGLTGIDVINAIRNGYIDNKGFKHKAHASGEDYYWQMVSNSILTNSDFAELIVYLPYKSELEEIREATALADGNQNKLAWINFAEDEDLPYLPDGGYYKNINVIRFKVPAEDKAALISRVEDASKLLVERL